MKIIVIGATGTLGQAIVRELAPDHEVIRIGHRGGDLQVDITDDDSVHALFTKLGQVEAIVSASGNLHFAPLAQMDATGFNQGLQHKLLGQIRVALIGQHHLRPGGSITLTSGIVSDEPIAAGSGAATVNAGLDAFVRAAACELGDKRINVVSPTVLEESLDAYGPYFPGFESVSAARAARAYRRSIEGIQTGRVLRVW